MTLRFAKRVVGNMIRCTILAYLYESLRLRTLDVCVVYWYILFSDREWCT